MEKGDGHRHHEHAICTIPIDLQYSIVILIDFSWSCSASQPPKYAPDGPLNQMVSNYEESGHDLEATVNELGEKYRVPVDVDLEALSDRHPTAIKVSRGSVANVLNAIVAQQHGFKWAEVNGVVNIGPQHKRKRHIRATDCPFPNQPGQVLPDL